MPRPVTGTMFAVNLDNSSGTPLFQQLYEHIRDGILAGRLCAGTRLPASRTLAGDLRVSRTTVVNAFDQLRAEGYLRGRVGSGTRVVSMLPETTMRVAPARAAIRKRLAHDRWLLQRMHGRWPDAMGMVTTAARPLRPGNPDVQNFPRDLWARLTAKHWRTIDPVL